MTESYEFNAATVEEALNKATKKLGVSIEDLPYEVVDDGSPGFLGIGARDARILVTVKDFRNTNLPESSGRDLPNEQAEQEQVAETVEDSSIEDSASISGQGVSIDSAAPEDLLSEVEEFATTAVRGMGFEARVDVYDADEFIAVDVSPEDTGLFIGQKGETIDALQHLLNISIYKDRDFVKRIIVDSEGYRQRRIEAVQGMAHRMARRAAREGRTIELPPMNSSERRVVHMYLKENPKVSTNSEGTGANRRVNISPVR